MWQYVQDTGGMYTPSGSLLKPLGYAGAWDGVNAGGPSDSRNKPDLQCVKDRGPIPRGTYTIGTEYKDPQRGPITMALDPDAGNNMCSPKRDLFRIHGDKIGAEGQASDGCIIMGKTIRQTISASADRRLRVVRTVADLAAAPVGNPVA